MCCGNMYLQEDYPHTAYLLCNRGRTLSLFFFQCKYIYITSDQLLFLSCCYFLLFYTSVFHHFYFCCCLPESSSFFSTLYVKRKMLPSSNVMSSTRARATAGRAAKGKDVDEATALPRMYSRRKAHRRIPEGSRMPRVVGAIC